MPVTTTEVIDTAVKVGLGALLTSGATILAARLAADRDWKRKKRERRFEMIEKTAATFHSTHTQLITMGSEYAVALSNLQTLMQEAKPSDSSTAEAKRDEMKILKVEGEVLKTVGKILAAQENCIIKLHESVAFLYLIGALEGAARIEDYGRALISITEILGHRGTFDNPVSLQKHAAEWDSATSELVARQARVWDTLRRYFDTV